MAGRQGFEPRFHGPEPCVLPLDEQPAGKDQTTGGRPVASSRDRLRRGSLAVENFQECSQEVALGDDAGEAVAVEGTVNIDLDLLLTTPAPCFRYGTILEIDSPSAVDGRAMIGLPPRDRAAPRVKST